MHRQCAARQRPSHVAFIIPKRRALLHTALPITIGVPNPRRRGLHNSARDASPFVPVYFILLYS